MWPFLPRYWARPLTSLGFDAALVAFEAQQVIALRMLRIAAGGALADREIKRMVSEKALAGAQVALEAAASVALGRSTAAVSGRALRAYRKRVRANRRRLRR